MRLANVLVPSPVAAEGANKQRSIVAFEGPDEATGLALSNDEIKQIDITQVMVAVGRGG